MQVDTLSGGEHSITNSEAFYGDPHFLPADLNRGIILIENGTVNDWMLPLILLGLFFFTIAWYNFSSRTKQNLQAVFSLRFFNLVDKERSFFQEAPTYLLFGNFLLIISLLLYQTLQHHDHLLPWVSEHPVYEYVFIFGAVLLFYPVKLAFIRFLAWVFATTRATYLYFENILLVNNFMGLLFLPFVFYNAYKPSVELLILMWGAFLAINVYKVIRGAYLSNSESGFSLYYLFLYLCAVEIAPLFIIGKAVTAYIPGITGIFASH